MFDDEQSYSSSFPNFGNSNQKREREVLARKYDHHVKGTDHLGHYVSLGRVVGQASSWCCVVLAQLCRRPSLHSLLANMGWPPGNSVMAMTLAETRSNI